MRDSSYVMHLKQQMTPRMDKSRAMMKGRKPHFLKVRAASPAKKHMVKKPTHVKVVLPHLTQCLRWSR